MFHPLPGANMIFRRGRGHETVSGADDRRPNRPIAKRRPFWQQPRIVRFGAIDRAGQEEGRRKVNRAGCAPDATERASAQANH